MKTSGKAKVNRFSRGDTARVRSFREIAATLDNSGMLEGVPFLPEMLKYCGRTYTVRWSVNKVLQGDSKGGLRYIHNTVLLDDTICDGEAHGDCQRMCFFLWKTAWLDHESGGFSEGVPDARGGLIARRKSEEQLLPRGHICQATALTAASLPLRNLDPRRYYWDLTSRLYKPTAYLHYLIGGIYRRTLGKFIGRLHHDKGPRFDTADPERLGLKRGDLVEVKSVEEIRATLNPQGLNRGLYFLPGMWGNCEQRLRVLRPVYRMLSERTGEMRSLKNTVVLEGITCNGQAHGGCQRGCYVFWKEIWLRRVPDDLRRPTPLAHDPQANQDGANGVI